ncbi:MAG TPA: hypothetical protein VFF06_28495 [Polyangia bacterium]|nr:hypothetical protein [Polyangia bacterium]
MRLDKLAWIAVLTASLAGGCASPDVTGPFTGSPHYYVVDGLTMPRSRTDFADDLNGDARVDNQLGAIAEVLDGQGFGPSGLPADASLTLLTDDATLEHDEHAAIVWQGARDAEPVTIGGRLESGRFTSNRTRTTLAPASGTVALPLVDGADPAALDVIGLEIELTPDGADGFDGELHAALDPAQALSAAYGALLQMLAARPLLRSLVIGAFDADGDGRISLDEFAASPAVHALAAPDVQLFDDAGRWAPNPANDHKDSLSLGARFHLARKER